MDLLSRLNDYSDSDSDEYENVEATGIPKGYMIKSSVGIKDSLKPLEPISEPIPLKIAPEVDITDLEEEKRNKELTRFETTNTVLHKPNHLTGVLE